MLANIKICFHSSHQFLFVKRGFYSHLEQTGTIPLLTFTLKTTTKTVDTVMIRQGLTTLCVPNRCLRESRIFIPNWDISRIFSVISPRYNSIAGGGRRALQRFAWKLAKKDGCAQRQVHITRPKASSIRWFNVSVCNTVCYVFTLWN